MKHPYGLLGFGGLVADPVGVNRRFATRAGLAMLGPLLALGALAACEPLDASLDQDPAGDVDAITATLDALPIGQWAAMTGYSRDLFDHWQSQGDGCDTRDVVLRRDGQNVTADEDCRITGGTWFSVYDGRSLTDPADVDIDHMVPLANAWRTGAAEWSDEQRAAFANDLDRPQLIAVSSSSNRSKGDQDPSQWRPPRREYWCEYAQSWITVKAHWRLSVTADEKAALADMLGTCP